VKAGSERSGRNAPDRRPPVPDPQAGVLHGTLTIVRSLAATPSRVFAAFADPTLRARWFHIPGDSYHELDFRIGGRESLRGAMTATGEPEQVEYNAQFMDLVADRRIVFVYELLVDGRRRSVSLVTIELTPDGGGTRLAWTEQYVFVALTGDGRADVAEREGGTRLRLNSLAGVVTRTDE
jgi:uncharacterized protein YndB with AHSA1/START domain